MINVGYYNYISQERVVCIMNPNSKPTRSLVQNARKEGRVVDLTMGKRTRSVIVMNSNHIVLAPSLPKTIVERIKGKDK